jgi:glycosyltransferase involved in cell wall biosynthesis
MSPRFSFIVPFHRDLASLARCLTALVPLPPTSELIIAADGAIDDCRHIALEHGARVVMIDGPSGPATARNAAAAAAVGDVFVFIDADVVVSRSGLARLVRIFRDQPSTTAVFGAYDDHPAHPGFMSQYKNLSHACVHRSSPARALTFWAGFGAVRRGPFHMVGGFDERFERPSVEDIDLGYRLTEAGYEVVVDPALTACHLKRWTLRSAIVSDVRDRGIPWTQLVLRYGVRRDHLNLSARHRWSVVFAYLALVALMLALYDGRFAVGLALSLFGMIVMNGDYYRFFYRTRGGWFAFRVWPMHVLHHLCNGVSFATGTLLFVAARHLRLRLPYSLATDAWSGAPSRPLSTVRHARFDQTDSARF